MKMLTILLCLMCGSALAFDPAGPPPKRTLEWTARILAHVIIPRIDFEDTPIMEAVKFASRMEVPKQYKVTLKVSGEEGVRDKRINLKAKDITQMELLAAIAEQAGLDLLIQPGVVVLVPRSKIAEQAAPSDGDKPSN